MNAISAAGVWELRRGRARRTLSSSKRLGDTIANVAQRARPDDTTFVAVAAHVATTVGNRRELLDALSLDDVGPLGWVLLRNEVNETAAEQARYIHVLNGLMMRDLDLARVRAAAAQRYLTEIGGMCGLPWTGMALPGVSDEHERHHGTVQYAFASADFWDLPILAHEFGHVLEGSHRATAHDGIEQTLDFQSLVKSRAVEFGRDERIVREYLSDAFAVYVAGPAFVATQLLISLDPSAQPTFDPNGTHPSDSRRAVAACALLARLDDGSSTPFAGVAAVLRELWIAMASDAGVDLAVADALERDLPLVDSLWDELSVFKSARFTTSRWAAAADAASRLRSDFSILDVPIGELLVAAWQIRLEHLSGGKDVDAGLGDRLLTFVAGPMDELPVPLPAGGWGT